MMTFSEAESEDVRHGDSEDQRELLVEYPEDVTGTSLQKAVMTRVKLVCSCGSTRCQAIERFGLPAPVFYADIEPLGPQHVRDERAIAVKRSLG